MSRRRLTAAALAVLALLCTPSPATAGDRPTVPWTGTNAYGFAVGDSVLQQCGETFGVGWRSLGFIGWPGADTAAMRGRLDGTGSGWPAWTVTEPSVADERVWWRDAGWLLIALGTNDVKTMTADQFAAQIDWYLGQSRGRPVLWFDIVNPPHQAQVDAFNAQLHAATDRWPNLKVLPWAAWVAANPGALLDDGVHIATGEHGCQQGRWRLAQAGAPDEPGKTAPRGHWYAGGPTSGDVRLNGWGATNSPNRLGALQVNVRADYAHVGRWPVDKPTTDLWAQATSGRAFGVRIDPGFRGRVLCLDLVDAAGQFTPLGCRTA